MQYLWKYIYLMIICSLPLRGSWYDVCIDPGHCGDAQLGALGVNGNEEPDEYDFNLDIALVCEADLNSMGWTVILTRQDEHHFPVFTSKRKVQIANGEKLNDIGQKTDFVVSRAVSIHYNSSTNPNAHGTETYYSPANLGSFTFATSVHNGAWNYLPMFPYAQNCGVKSSFFSFIMTTSIIRFISSPIY